MKTHFFKTLLWVSFLLLFSCSSDDQKQDACKDNICLNGGYCLDGSCKCPDGYYGQNCELQIKPAYVILKKALVRKFYNSDPENNFWDNSTSGYSPDIYLSLYRNSGNNFILQYESDEFYKDAISPGEFEFTIDKKIVDLDSPYLFALFNYNGMDAPTSDDEIMGQSSFFVYDPENSFPEIITVDIGTLVVDIYIEYHW